MSASAGRLPLSTDNFLKCPKCGKQIRAKRLPRHLRRAHDPVASVARDLARELGVTRGRILSYLYDFGRNTNSISDLADEIRKHFRSDRAHSRSTKTAVGHTQISPGGQAGPRTIRVASLPFELLPPGTWDVDRVIDYYRQQADRLPTAMCDRGVDPVRIEKIIHCLHPVKCYRGTKQWDGYHAFEFAESKRVALECPIRGNATYVLWGNWQSMAAHPKRHVWKCFPRNYARIVHMGDWRDWIGRIRGALLIR
jgi:hypothetical protein